MPVANERIIGILETVPSADAEEKLLAAFAIVFSDAEPASSAIDKISRSANDKDTLQD